MEDLSESAKDLALRWSFMFQQDNDKLSTRATLK